MKLIIITKENLFAEEAHLINQLFEAGLECLHLRKPKVNIDDQRTLLKAIDKKYHSRIVLHDCFNLTKEFNLKGIHLNSRNTRPSENLQNLTLSKSCHSLVELEDISNFDYVFLSPIFDSISKTGYKQAFSEEELLQAKNNGLINEKIIALGGIDSVNISQLKQYNFGGAAVLGSIWKGDENAVQNYFNIKKDIT